MKESCEQYKTYLDNNGYNIAIKHITEEQLKKIETDLTLVPNMFEATAEDIKKAKYNVFSYSTSGDAIIVPRYYGISRFGKPDHTDFDDAEEIDMDFVKQLRPKQQKVVDLCIRYITKNGGGLLSVPCGFGKTVCALYIAQALGLKTLVVVHQSFLLNQWIARATEFLNIKKENIGVIRRDICTIEGKDLVIGMIQTMSRREYNSLYKQFGLVIYDEAHHVASKFYSKTLMRTSSKYTLALTATPYRGDGLIKAMYWFTGGTIYREKMKMNVNVVVKNIVYKSTDKRRFSAKLRWFKGKTRPDPSKMISNILDIESRNDMMINMITNLRRNQPERKILILSGRIEHLEYLKLGVDSAIKTDVDAGLIDEDDIYSCFYIGPTKPHKRQEAEERGDIIFATYGMAEEGLDIKRLNTLIFASPKKDIVQSSGRIMRTILKAGDVRPLIIDIQDDLQLFNKWSTIRTKCYSACKYKIEEYYMIDDKFMTGNRYFELDDIEDKDRAMHHPDMQLHKMINDSNYQFAEWKKIIRGFEDECSKIENKYNKEKIKLDPVKTSQFIDHQKKTLAGSDQNDSCEKEKSGYSESSMDFLTDHDIDKKYDLVNFSNKNDLRVFEDFEPYKIKDVLYVDALTTNDFENIVLKNTDIDSDKLDIDGDVALDEENMVTELLKYRGPVIKTLAEKIKSKRLV
jgi:superfamily II DNA or RNA helicase